MSDIVKINLSQLDPLPDSLVDSDVLHINRQGTDYRAPALEVLKATDIKTSLNDNNEDKPAAASITNELKRLNDWQNNADGIVFKFNSIWTVVRNGNNLTVTIPAGKFMLIDGSIQLTTNDAASLSVNNSGGIKLTVSGSVGIFTAVNDLSSLKEGDDDNYIIAKNIDGVLKSRLPSITSSMYAQNVSLTQMSWNFDNSTVDADPSVGELRMNNADPSLVTELYISKTSQQSINVEQVLLNIQSGDVIQLIQETNGTKFIIGIAGVVIDASNYVKIPITITDNGTLFDTGQECSTNIYYEDDISPSDITRHYTEVAVSASQITMDFNESAEAWVTKVNGGGVIVGENISVVSINDANKRTANLFIEVTGTDRDIVIDSSVRSNDSRWDDSNNKLVLPVGNYLLRFQFDGNVISYLEVLPEVYGSTAGRYGIVFKYEADTANTAPSPNYMKFDNIDLSLVTRVNLSKTMLGIDISSLISDLDLGMEIIAYQSDDVSKFISATVNGVITDQAGYVEVPITVNDSGTVFDVNGDCSTNMDFAQVSAGGGHVIQEQIDGDPVTSTIQRSNLLFDAKNGEAVISDDIVNDRTVYTPKLRAANDFVATGEQAGDLIQRNAANDGYEPSQTAVFDSILISLESNLSADGQLSTILPAGYEVKSITIQEISSNAAGNISIGTVALGTQIVNAFTIGADADSKMTLVSGGEYQSSVNDTDLYVSSSGWGSGVIQLNFTFIKVQ